MIDLENVNLSDAERAAYSSGDTLTSKLLARIMDLEEELARIKYAAADDSTSDADKQVIFDAIVRGEGS